MKLVLSLLAVVGFSTSLHAGSLENWDTLHMIRGGVDFGPEVMARNEASKPAKNYSSYLAVNEPSKVVSSGALVAGMQSGQGFSGSGIRSVR